MVGTVYIFVNGIRTDPRKRNAWTDRAVTHTILYTGMPAEKLEYFTLATTRRFIQSDVARDLADLIMSYINRGWKVILVGHSNGCALIVDARRLVPAAVIEAIHMFSPACSSDPYKNGLNNGLCSQKIGKLSIYIAGSDSAMKLARMSQKLFGWLGLGYGALGGLSLAEAQATYPHASIIYEEGYGHSDWWQPGVWFRRSMKRIYG